jgi:hypothetical protein
MPAAAPARFAEDRSLAVQPAEVVRTAWIDVFAVRHANRARLDFAAIERAGRRLLQLGGAQPWPLPNGAWDGPVFVLSDGRHQHLAAIALGHERLLVAWIEPAAADAPGGEVVALPLTR